MMKLQTTLARLGAAQLSFFLGEPTIKLLEILDEKNLGNNKLAELVLMQLGPENILLNPQIRVEIIAALPRDEANLLAKQLQLTEEPDPYASLGRVYFRRGQLNTNLLFTFFGCEPPSDDDDLLTQPEKIIPGAYPLFEHQRIAYWDALHILHRGNPQRVLLHMPTGAGKTRIAMNLICQILRETEPDKLVVWLAHSEELCEQAAEEFEKSWSKIGDRPTGIYRHFGPYRVGELTRLGGGLLVASLALLYRESGIHSTSFFALSRRVSLIVMDEAHQAIAPTYNLLLNLLSPGGSTPILGLSATPGRSYLKPEEDLRLAEFFAKQKVTLRIPGYDNPIQYLVDEGYLAKAEYITLPYVAGSEISLTIEEQKSLQDGFDLPERIVKHLASDHLRNLLIIKNVMQEADQGGKIIVFGCSVEHAILLCNILRVRGYNAASVTSETPLNTRRYLINEYRSGDEVQILTNFGVLTTGFDAPRTNVAVIARPTSSVVLCSQMIGRAIRGPRAGGNSTCKILTVVDQIPGFRSMAEAFTFWEDIWAD